MKNKNIQIAVLGAGYVGLTTAVILAQSGYRTILVEPDGERLNIIKQGRSFFYEMGLDKLLSEVIAQDKLLPTADYKEAVLGSQFIFSCVGTPDNPDGSSNLSYVFSAATSAAEYMLPGATFIQKSTVPVGTGSKVIDLMAVMQNDFHYVSNPEFLREGTALKDALYFDRIIVGGASHRANQDVLDIYKGIEKSRVSIANKVGLTAGHADGLYIETNLSSAELIKVIANAFLALKISFANNMAKLADQTSADIIEIMDAVGADRRIGRAFLNAGRGYGGGCFPKDVSGLISSALDYGIDMPIMTAAVDVNYSMPGYILNKLEDNIGNFANKQITVLGLSFKAGTSDARRSPAVTLANILSRNGANVTVYDPKANGHAKKDLRRDIVVAKTLASALAKAQIAVLATDWPEFNLTAIRRHGPSVKVIVDAMNVLDKSAVTADGIVYIGVGR